MDEWIVPGLPSPALFALPSTTLPIHPFINPPIHQMEYTSLLYDVRPDGVATITLNRPDVFNAFNDPLSYELQDALKQVARDAGVRAVVLTGAGRAFCSGQDL